MCGPKDHVDPYASDFSEPAAEPRPGNTAHNHDGEDMTPVDAEILEDGRVRLTVFGPEAVAILTALAPANTAYGTYSALRDLGYAEPQTTNRQIAGGVDMVGDEEQEQQEPVNF